jgi:hypothetical protein
MKYSLSSCELDEKAKLCHFVTCGKVTKKSFVAISKEEHYRDLDLIKNLEKHVDRERKSLDSSLHTAQ